MRNESSVFGSFVKILDMTSLTFSILELGPGFGNDLFVILRVHCR